jgi:regulator of protease activity HflC (stomatin/prohibitin superfamily)
VIAALTILWATVGVAALAWLIWTATRNRTGATDGGRGGRRAAEPSPAGLADDEWIYGARARPRPSLLEIEAAAERDADGIVKEAERKAREIVAAAEQERSRMEKQLARDQADLAEKTRRVADFLASMLAEVERTAANGSGTVSTHELEVLEALEDELRRAE